jgi:signal transduction histidine kinase
MKILSLLILVCLGIAFLIGITSLLSVIQINDIANELSENETPKITTLYQMEILLEEATKDIFDFSRLEQAPDKEKFQANTNDFKINADNLRRLAYSEDEVDKELTLLLDQDLAMQFSHFKDLGEKLISVQGNQSEKILQRRFLLTEKLDPIIDDHLQRGLNASDTYYAQKQQAVLEMEINLHELFSASSGYIVKPDPSLKVRVTDSISDFQYWFGRFFDLNRDYDGNNINDSASLVMAASSRATDTPRPLSIGNITTEVGEDNTNTNTIVSVPPLVQQEQLLQLQQIQNGGLSLQQYGDIIKQDFGRVSELTQNIIEIEDEEQNQLAEFTTAENGIRDTLDNKIKLIILQKIQGLEDSANSMTTIALVSIVIAIILAVVLGIIISNTIVKPIKRLRRAINEVEAGNLDAPCIDLIDGDRERGRMIGEDKDRASRGNNKRSNSRFASEELIDLSHSFNSMTKKLQANDRMQKEFLSIASHELRSPIQPILGYADLAIKGDVRCELAIEKIFTNALKLQSLANDILDVARIDAGQLRCVIRRVSFNGVVEDAVSSIRDSLGKDIDLEVQLVDPEVEIELDHDRIAQMLANILGNAAKFAKKGKIKIESYQASDNNQVEIRISDAAGGIPEEIIPRLFEKFATKDVGGGAKQGTGLGLYISKAIVNAHNGKISAYNNSEGGATFVISLPREQGRKKGIAGFKNKTTKE